ncbi:hypothetical protein B0T26DRAFT_714644 [Lasiosphaeria miniovina]|uniref:Ankyrin repeat protein n=1 Tax=Lasiosphaeria miniovina TaxID=1954250 RepID=A0AA40DT81_9PEZI|nr:uncharacterized protein B0T26DRAFT_714644 [Lasiosphaeria miniovina]KAK0712581.1 hypothetical protein B0T26DRAFT_714644 [Lasiosphaeria miniovina]
MGHKNFRARSATQNERDAGAYTNTPGLKAVKANLVYGSPVNTRDKTEKTPLHTGKTPLHCWALTFANFAQGAADDANITWKIINYAVEKHHRSVLKRLVDAGGRLDLRDEDGRSVKDIIRRYLNVASWERPGRPDENNSMALADTLRWIREVLGRVTRTAIRCNFHMMGPCQK